MIPIELTKIFVDNNGIYYVLFIAEEEHYIVSLASSEGAYLTFVDIGCAKNAHIQTIYQMLLNFKTQSGFVLNSVIIESKVGDIIYCSLEWLKNGAKIYNSCSLGDGLILSKLSGSDIFAAKNALKEIDVFEDWEIIDDLSSDY